jgi:hypothetical protein
LVETIQRIYYELTKKNMPIFGVSTKSLKDFVASANDKSRGF